MSEVNEAVPGVFNWVDLMSPDVDASKDFYGAVFGWEMEDQHDDDGNRIYVMCSLRGRTVAGIGGQTDQMQGAPPMWNSYVATDDIDKTTGLVEPAGGSVLMQPMDIFTSGRMAIYAAPDGAVISAWQPGDHIGAELVDEHGTWIWNELLTRDVGAGAAKPFYEQVFGWTGPHPLGRLRRDRRDPDDHRPLHGHRCTYNRGQLVWGPEAMSDVGTTGHDP